MVTKIKMAFSKIIAGVMTWGEWGKRLSEKEMEERIVHCAEHGITSFDHADIYGGYTTEAAFGRAFAKSGIGRYAVQLISKCGIEYVCDARPANRIKHYRYSKDYIVASVEASLRNLRTDYLDLLLLHRPSPLMEAEVIAEAVAVLKAAGKINDFGVSNFTPSQTALIAGETAVSVNQIEFSLTHFEPMLNGWLDEMQVKRIIPMAWSPLGTVFRMENEQTARIRTLLSQLSRKYGATEEQLLLAWVLQHPAGVHPVIGTTRKDRMTDAVRALDLNLELQDWFALWVASQGQKVP